ncbi:MAG: fatty acid kinase [Miltoncostaeaceae bacterium]|jgi:DAK2 domain fusion protein YloV|nr:fatty acid kinase [Miltoncostaeaceae bacterium]
MADRPETALLDRLAVALAAARAVLERRARTLDDLNVFPVADGDTGTNMLVTVRAVERAGRECAEAPWAARCETLSRAALLAAQGNSGMILSQLVRGAAAALAEPGPIDGPRAAAVLRGASDAADRAVRRPVEGTMLTVARWMADGAEAAGPEAGIVETLDAAVEAGRRAVAATTDMLPALRAAGVVDAGGLGVLVLVEGLAAALAGREPPGAGPEADGPPPPADHAPSRYRYCTSFLVEGPLDLAALEAAIAPLGDSLLVMGDERRAKVHVHTDAPERAVAAAAAHGAIGAPSVQDMRRQEAERAARLARPSAPRSRCAALCLVEGAGIAVLARGLGAEVLEVPPGEAPGEGALVAALAALGAPEVVLLAARPDLTHVLEQTAAAVPGAAAVVPAASAPAALAALVALDPELGAAENAAAMAGACAGVRAGAVDADGVRLDGEPLVPAGGLREGVVLLLTRVPEAELVTVLIGAGAGVAPEEVEAWVREALPGAEAEAHEGGQSAPALLVGIE